MGTWGAKNLECDCALDILGDESHTLVTEIIALAASEQTAEYDEYDHTLLFVRFEQLFALHEHGLLHYYPDPEEVADLKETFVQRWQEYREQEWPEREVIIRETFDRFVALCKSEQQRVAELPEINVIDSCELVEKSLADIEHRSHEILDRFSIEIPNNWNAISSEDWDEVPANSLIRELYDESKLQFDMKDYDAGVWKLELAQLELVTGLSLESDTIPPGFDPYVLVARLVGDVNAEADPYTLTFASTKALEARYQAKGEFVGGPCGSVEAEGFDFVGLQAFRHTKPGGELRMERELHFHKLSDSELIVLEFGGCQDNSDERKDGWLVQAIGTSIARKF